MSHCPVCVPAVPLTGCVVLSELQALPGLRVFICTMETFVASMWLGVGP